MRLSRRSSEPSSRSDPSVRAALLVRAARLFAKAGDEANALSYVEGASALDPDNDEYALALESACRSGAILGLGRVLCDRAEQLTDEKTRVAIQARCGDSNDAPRRNRDAARDSLEMALDEGEDADVLARLADDAEERGDFGEADDLLHRPSKSGSARKGGVRASRGQALPSRSTTSRGRSAVPLGPRRGRLRKIATRCNWVSELEEKRENNAGLAAILERELHVAEPVEDKLVIARSLAALYQGPLAAAESDRGPGPRVSARPRGLRRRSRYWPLSEKTENWPRVAVLITALIEIEGDEVELSDSDEAALGEVCRRLDKGDGTSSGRAGRRRRRALSSAYVDSPIGWAGRAVASKLLQWHGEAPPSHARTKRSAVRSIVFSVGPRRGSLEGGHRTRSFEGRRPRARAKARGSVGHSEGPRGLAVAHDLLGKELSGSDRADELVRQAEVLASGRRRSGRGAAAWRGRFGQRAAPQAEPLLARLALLTSAPGPVIDVYERQVSRCKVPADRMAALSRAAQLAAARARPIGPEPSTRLAIGIRCRRGDAAGARLSASQGDRISGSTTLRDDSRRRDFGGRARARDGRPNRASCSVGRLESRIETSAMSSEAFRWLGGDRSSSHVDPATLDALEELLLEVGDSAVSNQLSGERSEKSSMGPSCVCCSRGESSYGARS